MNQCNGGATLRTQPTFYNDSRIRKTAIPKESGCGMSKPDDQDAGPNPDEIRRIGYALRRGKYLVLAQRAFEEALERLAPVLQSKVKELYARVDCDPGCLGVEIWTELFDDPSPEVRAMAARKLYLAEPKGLKKKSYDGLQSTPRALCRCSY
jgi:hypothetical protein